MKNLFTLLVVAIVFISFLETGQAQEIETLWDIQVTVASKQEEKLSDAPGIISVVSSEEISGFGATSLWDVLNRVTGMYMLHAGTYMWNIGSIRGQNISVFDNHVLILLNGRPLRDGISGGHNNVFYNSFPLEGIERLEVIRGPGSVLYGSNAYAGVINIITRKGDEKTAVEGSVAYGSFNTLSVNAGGGINVNDDLNVNFGLRYFNDDGTDFGGVYDADILNPDGSVKNPATLGNGYWTRDNKSAFLDVNYKNLRLLAGYGDMFPYALIPPIKWDWGTQTVGEEISKMSHAFADLGYSANLGEDYSLDVNATYNGHLWNGMVGEDPDGVKADSKNTLIEATFKGSPVENLHFIVGGTYDYNVFSGAILADGNLSKSSAYAQVDYKLIEKIKLIAGAQLNMPQGLDANISPRAGLIANITENFGAKVLYSNAFRSPYPQETNVVHPLYTGNRDLLPELINTFEAQVFFQNEKVQTSLTYYNSHMTDLINKIPGSDTLAYYNDDPTKPIFATFYNDGEFDFWGIEYEGKYQLSEKFSLFTNAIYQQNENEDGVENAAIWPDIIVKGGILYQSESISCGIYNSFFGEPTQTNYILTEVKGKPAIESKNPDAVAYNLLSANLTVDIYQLIGIESNHYLKLGIYGDNLLDESIWFTEFARYELNSLPLHAGISVLGKLIIGM